MSYVGLDYYQSKNNVCCVNLFVLFKIQKINFSFPQVWDREILLQALKDYYDKDMELLLQDIHRNITDVKTNVF